MRKILPLLLLVVVSCTDEYHYDAPASDNRGIYFESLTDATEWVFGPDESQAIQFNVLRHDASAAATYQLTCSDEIGLPGSVSFAAGETQKAITATVNLPIPTFRKDVTISIAQGDRYTYGIPQTTLTLSAASAAINGWKSIYSGGWAEQACTIYYFGTDADGRATYGAKDMLGEGFMLVFTLDADGQATVERQDALIGVPYVQGITASYLQQVEGEGTYNALRNRLSFNLRYYIDGIQMYTIADESLLFPASFTPYPIGQ